MKTIFYEQNQLHISKKSKPGFLHIYINPNPLELNFIIELFLNSKNYQGLIVGDKSKILNQIKKHFVTIEAAGGIVLNNKNEVLIIKRLGKWDLPKGKLEGGETKQMGALREVEEECGIKGLMITKKLKPSYHVYSLNKDWILKTSFWYLMKYGGNERLIPQTEENITEATWVDYKTLDLEKLDTYPAIAKVLHQLPLLLE